MERKKYLMVDCEAIGFNGKHYANCIAYNLGLVVTDKQGNTYAEKGMIFLDCIALNLARFDSRFLRRKLTKLLQQEHYDCCNLIEGYRMTHELIHKYNIQGIIMYNAEFDYNALNATMANMGFREKFFPLLPIYDLCFMVRDTIGKQKTYEKQFESKVSVSTKYIYPYLFIGDKVKHFALEDAREQVKIWERVNRQHKKMNKFFMKG